MALGGSGHEVLCAGKPGEPRGSAELLGAPAFRSQGARPGGWSRGTLPTLATGSRSGLDRLPPPSAGPPPGRCACGTPCSIVMTDLHHSGAAGSAVAHLAWRGPEHGRCRSSCVHRREGISSSSACWAASCCSANIRRWSHCSPGDRSRLALEKGSTPLTYPDVGGGVGGSVESHSPWMYVHAGSSELRVTGARDPGAALAARARASRLAALARLFRPMVGLPHAGGRDLCASPPPEPRGGRGSSSGRLRL
jgi:hypothetical protein